MKLPPESLGGIQFCRYSDKCSHLPSGKLTWQWFSTTILMVLSRIFMRIFPASHVSFREGTLPNKTNIAPENRPMSQGNDRIPTIHFQRRTVSFFTEGNTSSKLADSCNWLSSRWQESEIRHPMMQLESPCCWWASTFRHKTITWMPLLLQKP